MATAEAEVEAFLSKAGPAHFSGALNEKVKGLLVHTTELKGASLVKYVYQARICMMLLSPRSDYP